MSKPRIDSFEDFWPYYVRAHRDPRNRALHVAGTLAALGCVAGAVVTGNPLLLAAAPIVGYGPAWFGHFVCEGNKPATFGYPLHSLRGDARMLRLSLQGKMAAEVQRCVNLRAASASAPATVATA